MAHSFIISGDNFVHTDYKLCHNFIFLLLLDMASCNQQDGILGHEESSSWFAADVQLPSI